MNYNILKGTVYITDDIALVKSVPDKTVKIISLDEENRLDPNDPNVVVGTCLLPPIESFIAEADGDEQLYDINYIASLSTPYVLDFIGALISALYRGISLLFYVPSLTDSIFPTKLMEMMFKLYGINIGLANKVPCSFDISCYPIWLNMMYRVSTISPQEYLYMFPNGNMIPEDMMNKLMFEIKPVGNSMMDRANVIREYQEKLKKNFYLKRAIYDIRG